MNKEFIGTLQTYYETGMEQMGLILYLDGPEYKTPNAQFDPNDKRMGPEFYNTYSGIVFLKSGDEIVITESQDDKLIGRKIVVGNKLAAAKDNFRFSSYPKDDKMTVLEWYGLFVLEKVKAVVHRPVKKVVLYGGTFDPIHLGHVEIIQSLSQFDEILILPGNNWTKNPPLFPLQQRIKSVEATFKGLPNIKVLPWALDEDTSSTFLMTEKIKSIYGVYPTLAIGADNVQNIEKWKNWNKLKKLQFIIFSRDAAQIDASKFEKQPMYGHVGRNATGLSSTQIRESGDLKTIPREALPFLDLKLLDMIKK